MLETIAELDTKSALRKSDLAWAYNKMGNAVPALGRREEATESLRKAFCARRANRRGRPKQCRLGISSCLVGVEACGAGRRFGRTPWRHDYTDQ